MIKPVLEIHDLTIGYPFTRREPHVVAEGISASLLPGELVCLIGPNGAGKSTLLHTITGMQKPLSGWVLLMGDDVHRLSAQKLAQQLSLVLTERVNVGALSGYALVALGRHPYTDWMGKLSAYDEAMIRWAVEAVGAQHLAERSVNELSDGERQKIMIARALAQEPVLMILDEPTAFLDLPRRVEIMQLLKQLTRITERTILLSTHDLDLALRTADRIWLLPSGGPLQFGAPEDLVLSGAFEAAFHSEGVEFDRQTGSFKINSGRVGVVTLIGEGIQEVWTRRALERAGYKVNSSPNGVPALVHIEVAASPETMWSVINKNDVHTYHSLYDLISALNIIAAAPQDQQHRQKHTM